MKRTLISIALFACFLLPFSIGVSGELGFPDDNTAAAGSDSGHSSDTGISFTRDIRPILSTNCVQCHGPDEAVREADLRLDRKEGIAQAFGGTDSEGVARIESDDPDLHMPPKDSHRELKPEEIQLLKTWAQAGAPFESHWAFEPPQKKLLPREPKENWSKNEIDPFVLRRLKEAGLTPNAEADRERLIRRVTFDLTGLPPTIEEIDQFVNDQSPQAYEKVVDRLLASKSFGERMTLNWLDAARYGDTSVFHADGRRDMWAWRDWVIDAYNDNMPFDQFTIKQLAGDLIPNGTWRDKVASAFNRNHGTTDEGGAIAEEYRVEYVVDRVKTTSTIWLGLTMECAQCHSHKYDPISQEEYYQFFAYFNQTSDPGMQTRNGNQSPILNVPNEANEKLAITTESELTKLKQQIADHRKTSEPAFEKWLAAESTKTEKSSIPADAAFHFPLDEVKKNKVHDAIDSKRTATVHGKVNVKPGKIRNALEFNGSAHLDFGQINRQERDQAFSLSALINWKKQDGAIFSKMKNGGTYRGYDLLISGGYLEFHLINTWPTDALKVRTNVRLKENTWQHVCMTYDGSSKTTGVKIYIDGVSVPWKVEQDGLKSTTQTDAPFLVGKRSGGQPLKGMLDDLRVYHRALSDLEVQSLGGAGILQELLSVSADKRTAKQNETLRDHFFSSIDKTAMNLAKSKNQLEKKLAELKKPLTTVMVMQEMPKPRMTYILDRGHYASPKKDKVIQPGTPGFLPMPAENAPVNRLGLAEWIVDPKNPLTARVTVNRYWQMLFGKGLVETVEDFGTQGNAPSHPELLDYLAVDFVQSGWNIKRIIKKIVMSATYRQSSIADPKKLAVDPKNQLLSRGARFRLMGEFLRDSALANAGLLNEKVGGPSVKPYQPDGLWNEVSLNGGLRFKRDQGENLYRKSMYIYWRRSAPMPSMSIFGTPSREKCVVRRAKTNTPLQALVTLNDEQFVEAARFLAQRVMQEKPNVEQQIILAYRMVTGVTPADDTVKLLTQTFESEKAFFEKNPKEADGLLATGERKRDETVPAADHAAMTIVSGILMNLDETLTKG